ncbi:DUF4928 family protein [Paenibacillus sedimenti]|uniref:DUF4928 family protein n=1 Tax=Paenibacillus sedimenti TaxID=2770274 RepID=A0A926KW40_9BACL|nr:DUF4928 family protein [Paenibacillus sedimenti]MBD0383273.1 DUF4928 family protein [Paenibacillus sedimenti]
MSDKLFQELEKYRTEKGLTSKGQLAVILHVSRLAKNNGLPLDPSTLVAESKGQVLGLGKAAVQSILKDHGINRVLAEEGGRTSRGSVGNMQDYVAFLNNLHASSLANLEIIENWWIQRVRDYFSSQPFTLRYDTSKSIRAIVRDLLSQAIKRQKENPGTMYEGAVLQHLVGAKLSLVLTDKQVEHHGFSVSDSVSGRSGDFIIDDVIIHVTTAPGEALMRKCKRNLESGARPIIVTTYSSMAGAESLARIQEIDGRIDLLEAEQFIATNVYELSKFQTADRKFTVEKLIDKYNEIVELCETDPSIKVTIG